MIRSRELPSCSIAGDEGCRGVAGAEDWEQLPWVTARQHRGKCRSVGKAGRGTWAGDGQSQMPFPQPGPSDLLLFSFVHVHSYFLYTGK